MFRNYHTGKIDIFKTVVASLAILILIFAIYQMWTNPIGEYDPCAAEGKTKVVTEYRSGVQYGRHTQMEIYTCK